MLIRIVIIIDSLKVGGAQKLVATLVSSAPKEQLELTIVNLAEKNSSVILEQIRTAGVQVHSFPSSSLVDPIRLKQLVDFLRTEKFDLIHTHLTYANILGCLAGYYVDIPVVTTIHSTNKENRRPLDFLITQLEVMAFRQFARRIMAVGYTVADAYKNRLGDRIVDVIPNGIPISELLPDGIKMKLRQEILKDISRPVIITVGRFVQVKGFEDLIDAFSLLQKRIPRPMLIMIGSGRMLNQIKKKISDLNLVDSVNCLGERSDVSHILSIGDIYVNASHREGLPLTILEAMMSGLPIVATAVGDIPRVVKDEETGLIVPPHEPKRLALAMDQLLDAPAKIRTMGMAARLTAIREYSIDVWMKRLSALYREALEPTNG
jgi:glycosyltransferase involved in cell wall biosynthesis